MRKISNDEFDKAPGRYVVRKASERGNPLCPADGGALWLGFDLHKHEFVDLPANVIEQFLKQKKRN